LKDSHFYHEFAEKTFFYAFTAEAWQALRHLELRSTSDSSADRRCDTKKGQLFRADPRGDRVL